MENPTLGLTNDQITSGTPAMKKIVLKAFYKDDKCYISPAKDSNGRYVGIQENIPEMEKLKMGYVPTIESRVKIYDGMEIDLNDKTWAKDWEWMKHCAEIADNFKEGQDTPGSYFYIFRPGYESAKKIEQAKLDLKLRSYILEDTTENLFNRVKVLGNNMDDTTVTDVQEYLLTLVRTSPRMIQNVYESKVYALELLYLHSMEKGTIKKKGGSFVFGDTFLGVDKKGVIAFFGNSRNSVITNTVEAVTYGRKVVSNTPLADESVSDNMEADEDAELEEREAAAKKVPTAAQKAAATRAAKKK